jgi:methionyl-tRNA synthetase
VDAFRYFLMAEMIPGQDASFTEDAFIRRYNADLANDLGNLLNRVTNMTRRFCDGKVPAAPASYDAEASEVRATVLAAVDSLLASLQTFRLDQGLTEILNAVKRVNKYLEEKQPWTLARDPDKSGVNAVMYVAAESLRILSQLLEPVMPAKMAELRIHPGPARTVHAGRVEAVRTLSRRPRSCGTRASCSRASNARRRPLLSLPLRRRLLRLQA